MFPPPSLLIAGETISLFRGKDLDGWTLDVAARDKISNATDIKVQDGVMTFGTRKGAWWNATPPSFIVRDGLLVSLGKCIAAVVLLRPPAGRRR